MTEPQLTTPTQQYRALRREVEQSVLPLATSIDGRAFTFQASLHGLELRLGGYVALEGDGEPRLGQVLTLELAHESGGEIAAAPAQLGAMTLRAPMVARMARGTGTILEGDGRPFHDALTRPATADEVAAWLERTAPRRAQLTVGELALAPGVPCRLDAGGFDRHTFLCGQSGSGKTYSLGVVLEQLLLETDLRMVILDPNSDYGRLGELRDDIDDDLAERYRAATAGVRNHTARAGGDERLRLRFPELEPEVQAALLHLDPIADREEHAELAALLGRTPPPRLEELRTSDDPHVRAISLRARSLGLGELGVWARDEPGSVLDALGPDGPRVSVVDLGSLPTRTEQSVVAASVLGALWQRREAREPVLIVIDEAHNVCPSRPTDAMTAIAREHCIRIAAEGRKFGLYLLVSTQRPNKVHEDVLSQADNLVLMRLNSSSDAALAQSTFSFVGPQLIARSSGFGLGEALVAGKISPHPALLRFGRRIAQEGGADVPATWAAPRA